MLVLAAISQRFLFDKSRPIGMESTKQYTCPRIEYRVQNLPYSRWTVSMMMNNLLGFGVCLGMMVGYCG